MFRKFLSLLLLVPLSLNGMWMVCAEAEASEISPSPEAGAVSEAQPVCMGNAMCPLHKPATKAATSDENAVVANANPAPGAICLISTDGTGASIAAVGFVYAPPAPVQGVDLSEQIDLTPVEAASCMYCDALLPHGTPPPRS